MSLREEIERRLGEYTESVIYKVPTQEKDLVADEIISKILDAAVEAVKTTKGVVTADDALWVINKLRGG